MTFGKKEKMEHTQQHCRNKCVQRNAKWISHEKQMKSKQLIKWDVFHEQNIKFSSAFEL